MIVKGHEKIKNIDMNHVTRHLKKRSGRMDVYLQQKSLGDIYDAFLVDKGHPNGDEIHVITDTGYILIFNHGTKRFITILHARGAQLKRYYDYLNEKVPSVIDKMADSNDILNRELGLNHK